MQTSVLRAWKGNKTNSEHARKEYIRLAKVKNYFEKKKKNNQKLNFVVF
jgi:hypothetical protein